jgi:CysZ protein
MLLALTRAFISLLHPRILWLMLWPIVAALGLWMVLAVLLWGQALHWVQLELDSSVVVQWVTTFAPLAFIAAHLAWVILVVALVPLVLVTAVVLVGIFAMPALVDHVAESSYPDLARRRGGTLAGSLANTAIAVIVFLVLTVLSLPLWVIPLLWPVLPVLLFAYLNQRVFRYDALAEHASATEMSQLMRRHRADLFLLGVVIAVLGHVPVFGLFVPVYAGLAFVHYCLDRLVELRAQPIEGQSVRL